MTTETKTSKCWIEHTLNFYADINPTIKKFGHGMLCALRFETVGDYRCCLTSKGYKGPGPAVLRILYDTKNLSGEEIMRNVLYM